jgi:hypothetical protein
MGLNRLLKNSCVSSIAVLIVRWQFSWSLNVRAHRLSHQEHYPKGAVVQV